MLDNLTSHDNDSFGSWFHPDDCDWDAPEDDGQPRQDDPDYSAWLDSIHAEQCHADAASEGHALHTARMLEGVSALPDADDNLPW